MIRRLLSVSGFTALSRLAGFARDVMMAAAMGAGPISDAFIVAFRLPNNFRAIFAEGAFNAAFLPRYSAAATRNGTAPTSAATRFADDVFAWQFAVQLVLLLLAFVFMRQIVTVLAPGFADNPPQRDLAITLSRITFPYLICITVVTQLSAMLNAVQRFTAAAASPILFNVAMIGLLLAASYFPNAAYAAAYGVLLAGFLQLVFMVWAASRAGITLRLRRPSWRPEVREFVGALGAATVGSGSVQIGLFIDTIIASFLTAGDLTALYYADRVNQLPLGVIVIALGTVLLPEMSARLAMSDEHGASKSQNRAVVLGMLLTLPCAAAFLIIPATIMRALFAHGAFPLQSADLSATALAAYAMGLPAVTLIRCVTPSFYARHDTATPVRATLLSVGANVAMKLVLVWGLGLGVVGLALGTSIGAWVNVAVLVFLARRGRVLVATTELKRAVLPVAAAVAAAGAGFFLGEKLGHTLLFRGGALYEEGTFVIAAALGGAAFSAVVVALRNELSLGRAREN